MTSPTTDPTILAPRLKENKLEPALKFPPQSKCSATISAEHISTVRVDVSDICLWIMKDVENFQECPIDEMLKDFLVHATGRPQDSFDPDHKTCLFEDCLKKVLPICNGEVQASNEIDVNLPTVKDYLVQYSEAHGKHENKFYASFVRAANVALRYLQKLETDLRPLKDDYDSSVCFHVHDPLTLRQGQLSERKPNVVVISQSDAYAANASGKQDCWQDILFKILAEVPKNPLEWRNIRAFVEFQRSTKKIAVPPDRYTHLPVVISNDEAEPNVPRARLPLSEPVRRSARQQEKARATNTESRKRTSEHLGTPDFQSKRRKFKHTASHPVIVQAGYYAAEMFAAFAARGHAIGLVVIGDILYVWWYDRQRTIQCSGFNFIEDLPRFLVLLLAMQCFEAKHWGLNPHVDPAFGPRLLSQKMTLRGDEGKEIQVDFRLSNETRVTQFDLNGRGTNILPVECKDLFEDSDIIAKTFWMEIMPMSETEILKKVQRIAETDPDVTGHIPQMLWFKIFCDTSTVKIREHLGLDTEGACILCMIIFRKLRPITELYGDEFLGAWWATVKCHHALWTHGVHHQDISPSNLMYHIDKQKQIVAVLNDFDMASTEHPPDLAATTRTQCTGTVPFMAVQLLTEEGLEGNIPHLYEHDAESFIWVLVWISLQYANGKLRGDHDRPLDEWLTVDPIKCRKEKSDLLGHVEKLKSLQAGAGHEQNWRLAKECIIVLMERGIERAKAMGEENLDADTAFERLLQVPTSHYLEQSLPVPFCG